MRTQSTDTSPEMEQVLIQVTRQLPPWRKCAVACSLSDTLAHGLFRDGPNTYLQALYGEPYAQRYRALCKKHPGLTQAHPDCAQSLLNMSSFLMARKIPFVFGSGIAISIYGFAETFHDVFIYVDYPRRLQCFPVLSRIGESWIDPMHLLRYTIIQDREMVSRAHYLLLEEHMPLIPIIAPEDLIVVLLQRLKQQEYWDDALYNGLLGVLKVQRPTLDIPYLNQQCATEPKYHMALEDAGIAA